jgi:hypothetical protein
MSTTQGEQQRPQKVLEGILRRRLPSPKAA